MSLFGSQTVTDDDAEAPRGASREARSSESPKVENTENWWKPFWTFSSLVIFAGVLWSAGDSLWKWLDQPVDEVAVLGSARHLERDLLAEKIAAHLDSTLLKTDLNEVQLLVKEQPWVRVAGIRRHWPSRLEVMIEEEVPVARWGEHGLLNHQGDIFWPELKDEYRVLPRLSGPSPDTGRVMSQFHDLNQMFRPFGLSVTGLSLEARGAWTLTLDNEIQVVLGREAINERLQRFLSLYEQRLSEHAALIEQVDIRYTNGVAVRWRETPGEKNAG